jgi:hypothetical protein
MKFCGMPGFEPGSPAHRVTVYDPHYTTYLTILWYCGIRTPRRRVYLLPIGVASSVALLNRDKVYRSPKYQPFVALLGFKPRLSPYYRGG